MNMHGLIVLKVGGSLYDLPDLAERLRYLCRTLATADLLIVPGGGAAADTVRAWDRIHSLGDESAHWLALEALRLPARLLQRLLQAGVIDHQPNGPLTILDPLAFCLRDEPNEDRLPQTWDATSDSLAARVAEVYRAKRLILLKSLPVVPPFDPASAARAGLIDPIFPILASRLRIPIEFLNLRDDQYRQIASIR